MAPTSSSSSTSNRTPSVIPNLNNAPLNFKFLREQSVKDVIKLLDNIRGRKCLVLDRTLSGSLTLLLPTTFLKEHGVEQFIRLSPVRKLPGSGHSSPSDAIQGDVSKVIYLISSQLDLARLVSSHIHHDLAHGLPRDYFVFFVPRRTVVCDKIFEEEKLHKMLTIGELPLYMVPIDEDVLSLELDLSFKECLVDGDASTLWHVAKAIHKLEFSFGLIPNVRAKGKASVKVSDILNRMQSEDPVNKSEMDTPQINTLVLIDREVDMITPMCTQLTYEGLLDELLHINNGAVEVDSSILGLLPDKKMKVPLNSSDKLYREIRDLNLDVVGQVLRQKATSIKQEYNEINTTQTVSELKDFVKKLHSLHEMDRHVGLAQHLSTFTSKPSFHNRLEIEHTIVEGESWELCYDYIEEMIHKQEPISAVLRLLVLLSLTSAGLPKKNFDSIRREILHSYGFEYATTLHNLVKAGLLKKPEFKTNWLTIKRALQLVVDDIDPANPKDIGYVFSGYAPLSVRLVQHAVRTGWHPIEEILRLLPGPHSEHKRGGYSRSYSQDMMQGNIGKMGNGRRLVVLVVFVGGVTFAEIAALRFLSSQEGMSYELIVATTKLVNGETLLEVFIDKSGQRC